MNNINLKLLTFIITCYFRKRKNIILSINKTSFIGLLFGIAIIIISFSLMNGFEKSFTDYLLKNQNEILLTSSKVNNVQLNKVINIISNLSDVKEVMPFSRGTVLIIGNKTSYGGIITGIDKQSILFNTKIKNYISNNLTIPPKDLLTNERLTIFNKLKYHSYYDIVTGEIDSIPGIILGRNFFQLLDINIGDKVAVVSDISQHNLYNSIKIKWFEVVGAYISNDQFLNYNIAITLFNESEKIITKNKFYNISIRLKNPFQSKQFCYNLNNIIDNKWDIQEWQDSHKNSFAILKKIKYSYQIILFSLIIFFLFNIRNSLRMIVKEKSKDIAIYKSLGLFEKQIKAIFLFQGIILCFSGIIIGVLFGLVLTVIISHVPLSEITFLNFPKGILINDKLPVQINKFEIIFINIFFLLISILTALKPAGEALLINTSEILKNE